MDYSCPKCREALIGSKICYAKPKMKGIFSSFVEKKPLICQNCNIELEVNHNKFERINRYFCFFFYVFLLYINAAGVIVLNQVFLIYAFFLMANMCFEKVFLKKWPRYCSYNQQTQQELRNGYLMGILIYFLLALIIIFALSLMFAGYRAGHP